MKKVLFYIPAILFSVFYIWAANTFGIRSISPIIFVLIGLFLVAGFLLSKDKFWGGILGILPGIYVIYSIRTNFLYKLNHIQLILGIMILVFYIICSGFVIYNEKKTRSILLGSDQRLQ